MKNAMAAHYLGMAPLPAKYQDYLIRVNSDKVISLLGDMGISWSYEIQNEGYGAGGTSYHVAVVLYLPGFVRTGVAVTTEPLNEGVVHQTIQRALHNACLTLSRKKNQPAATNETSSVNSDTENHENQNIAHKGSTPPVQNGGQAPTNQPPNQAPPAQQHNQQSQNRRWSQEHIDAMNQFKERYEIVNDEQLVRYLSLWRPEITSKRQLNPENVTDFITWTDNMSQNLF